MRGRIEQREVVLKNRDCQRMLMIYSDIHHPVMVLSPEDRCDREKVNEACIDTEKSGSLGGAFCGSRRANPII